MNQEDKTWCVYMVRCADGTLYTGSSNDVPQRIMTHNTGRGAKYTRARLPVLLVYQKSCADRSQACQLEYQIKQYPKQKKEKLIDNKV